MNVHKNAPLTPKDREAMARSVVEGGLSQADAAYQFNMTAKTVAKWVKRFRAEGVEGLRDRSSRPHSSPSQTPPATCAAIETLRRQRHTGKQIAAEVEVSPATVSQVLRRLGLNRVRDLEPGRRSPPMPGASIRSTRPARQSRPIRGRPEGPTNRLRRGSIGLRSGAGNSAALRASPPPAGRRRSHGRTSAVRSPGHGLVEELLGTVIAAPPAGQP